jgi:hypothetical protein
MSDSEWSDESNPAHALPFRQPLPGTSGKNVKLLLQALFAVTRRRSILGKVRF